MIASVDGRQLLVGCIVELVLNLSSGLLIQLYCTFFSVVGVTVTSRRIMQHHLLVFQKYPNSSMPTQ